MFQFLSAPIDDDLGIQKVLNARLRVDSVVGAHLTHLTHNTYKRTLHIDGYKCLACEVSQQPTMMMRRRCE